MALTADELDRFNSLYCRATRTDAEDKELADLNSKAAPELEKAATLERIIAQSKADDAGHKTKPSIHRK